MKSTSRSVFALFSFLCFSFSFIHVTTANAEESPGRIPGPRPGSCDQSILANLNKALPDLISRTNKKMQKHIDFYLKMEMQDFMTGSLSTKLERALEIMNQVNCASPCIPPSQKTLQRAERLIEKAKRKQLKFQGKLDSRVCKVDVKWHKIEARMFDFAIKCGVGIPAHELHSLIPVQISCHHQ